MFYGNHVLPKGSTWFLYTVESQWFVLHGGPGNLSFNNSLSISG